MANSELELLKQEIDLSREQMYAYMEYPEIFKDELLETSNKIVHPMKYVILALFGGSLSFLVYFG